MFTLGTIIAVVLMVIIGAAVMGIVLDILGALGIILAVPFAIVGKELVIVAIGATILYFYLKSKKVF